MAFQIDIEDSDMFKKEVIDTPNTLQVRTSSQDSGCDRGHQRQLFAQKRVALQTKKAMFKTNPRRAPVMAAFRTGCLSGKEAYIMLHMHAPTGKCVVASSGDEVHTCWHACVYAVLEVYSDWCGPCKAINNTCKRLYFEHGDRGLKFYTVAAGRLDFTMPYKGKCKPIFMFWRNGAEAKDLRIEGINCPKLVDSIMSQLKEGEAA